jgi:hypothetical protein
MAEQVALFDAPATPVNPLPVNTERYSIWHGRDQSSSSAKPLGSRASSSSSVRIPNGNKAAATVTHASAGRRVHRATTFEWSCTTRRAATLQNSRKI